MFARPLVRAAGAIALVFTLVCCFQLEQATTLYPDGSGKLELLFGLKRELVETIRELGDAEDDPLAEFRDPLKLLEDTEGFIAWTPGKEEITDDYISVRITGYFEDISKVKLFSDDEEEEERDESEERKHSLAFDYSHKDDLHTLIVRNEFADERLDEFGLGEDEDDELGEDEDGESDEEDDEFEAEMMEMMRGMFEGMSFAFSITVPGEIVESEGLEATGRTASFAYDDELLFAALEDENSEAAKKMDRIGEVENFRVVWKTNEVSPEALEAFHAEMAAAKAEWDKRLAELEKGSGEE